MGGCKQSWLKGRYTGMNIGTEYNTTYGYDDYGRLNQVNDIEFSRTSSSDLLGTVTRPNNINTIWNYEANRNPVSEVNNGVAGVSWGNGRHFFNLPKRVRSLQSADMGL